MKHNTSTHLPCIVMDIVETQKTCYLLHSRLRCVMANNRTVTDFVGQDPYCSLMEGHISCKLYPDTLKLSNK